MKSNLILLGVVVIAFLPATGCEKRKAGKPRLGEVERLPRVETVVLGKPTKLEVVRSYTAIIESYEKADVCAMVKGFVKDLPAELDIGREVKKGAPLFSLYVPDLVADRNNKKALVEQNEKALALALEAVEVAKAEIKEAQSLVLRFESDQEFRRAQFVRITRLVQGDTLSKQQVDEAKLQLDAAQAALTAAQAQVITKQSRERLAQKESQLAAARVAAARSEEAKAEVQVEFATLRAPFDGVITKRWVDSGTTVKDPGMPLFTLMRTDKMRVIIDIPERDVPYFRTAPQGNSVELLIPALTSAGGNRFTGAITHLASALDPVTRTMRAEMHVENKPGEPGSMLKPQMTGTALVTLASRNAYSVPSSALVRTANKMEIFVVADPVGDPAKGTVKRVEVETGVDTGLQVEIKNDALSGREIVITRGAGVLRPGDQVIAIAAKQAE
jgi:RND family efflux transporter MFP subunit